MLDVSRRSAAVVVLLGSLVARGDGCEDSFTGPGPGAVTTCRDGDAYIALRPGYCAPIPNCIAGTATYDMTYLFEVQTALPAWGDVRTARDELADSVTTPEAALRVCALRAALPGESPSEPLKLKTTQSGVASPVSVLQTVRVTVRETIPTVSIAGIAARSQWLREGTNTATGEISAVARGAATFRMEMFARNSEVSSCADLQWTIRPTDGLGASSARVDCDPARSSEATVALDAATGRSYAIVLEMTEPDGYKSLSNTFVVRTAPDDPNRVTLEIAGAPGDIIAPYEQVMLQPQCTRGLWVTSSCSTTLEKWFLMGTIQQSVSYPLTLITGESLQVGLSANVPGVGSVNAQPRTFTAR